MKTIQGLRLQFSTEKQRDLYQKILGRPHLVDPYKCLARLLEREGARKEAAGVLKLAGSRFPSDRLLREQLAALYEEMGKVDRASDIYRVLVREGESWSAYVRLARIYRKRGDVEAAISLFQSVPPRHPFKERTYPYLFTILFIFGDHKRGIKNLKEAIRHCGPNHRYIKDLGRLHMKAGRKLEAIEYLKKALRYDPEDLDAVKLIALAYLDLGNYALARRFFQQILKRDPGAYQAQIQLAELCLFQGRLTEAKRWLDKIRRNQKRKGEPWDSRSKLAMGEYYLKKGDFKKAVVLTVEGLKETPFYYPMELVHGYSLLEAAYRARKNEFKTEVFSLIRKALTENPDVFSSLIALAQKLEAKKKLALAKEVLEHLLLTFPGNTLVLVNLAAAQFERGMTESAIQLAQAAASTPSGSFFKDKRRALNLLTRVCRAAGQKKAARDYERQAKSQNDEAIR